MYLPTLSRRSRILLTITLVLGVLLFVNRTTAPVTGSVLSSFITYQGRTVSVDSQTPVGRKELHDVYVVDLSQTPVIHLDQGKFYLLFVPILSAEHSWTSVLGDISFHGYRYSDANASAETAAGASTFLHRFTQGHFFASQKALAEGYGPTIEPIIQAIGQTLVSSDDPQAKIQEGLFAMVIDEPGGATIDVQSTGSSSSSGGSSSFSQSSGTCGDGLCNASENCQSCSLDCQCGGSSSAPDDGGGVCGDSICSSNETCSSCAADCGTCNQPPAVTLTVTEHPIAHSTLQTGQQDVSIIRWTMLPVTDQWLKTMRFTEDDILPPSDPLHAAIQSASLWIDTNHDSVTDTKLVSTFTRNDATSFTLSNIELPDTGGFFALFAGQSTVVELRVTVNTVTNVSQFALDMTQSNVLSLSAIVTKSTTTFNQFTIGNGITLNSLTPTYWHIVPAPASSTAASSAGPQPITTQVWEAKGLARAIVHFGNVLYTAGSFTEISGERHDNLVALDDTTGLPTAWQPSIDGQVNSMILAGTTLYITGGFTHVNGQARNGIAAFDLANGGALTSFSPALPASIDGQLAANASTVFMAYTYEAGNSPDTNRVAIAAIDRTTGTVRWTKNIVGWPPLMAANDQTLYVSAHVPFSTDTDHRVQAYDGMTGQPLSNWSGLIGNGSIGGLNGFLYGIKSLYADSSGVYVGGEFQWRHFDTVSNQLVIDEHATLVKLQPENGAVIQKFDGPVVPDTLVKNANTMFAGGFRLGSGGGDIITAFDLVSGTMRSDFHALPPTRSTLQWSPYALTIDGNTLAAAGWPARRDEYGNFLGSVEFYLL